MIPNCNIHQSMVTAASLTMYVGILSIIVQHTNFVITSVLAKWSNFSAKSWNEQIPF